MPVDNCSGRQYSGENPKFRGGNDYIYKNGNTTLEPERRGSYNKQTMYNKKERFLMEIKSVA